MQWARSFVTNSELVKWLPWSELIIFGFPDAVYPGETGSVGTLDLRLRNSQVGRLLRLRQLTFVICNHSEQMCAKLRPLPTGEDEIMTKGEGIYKTIVTAIPCLLGTSVIFVFPVGTSFIFSHILCVRKKTNLLVAWVMSFFVIPVTFAGLYFSRFSFELLYRYLFLLLLIIILLSLFYSKAKWIIAIVSLYSLYFAELYFLEILVAV